MRATRNFRLSRTQSVLVPPVIGRGLVAGEACTELGCESIGGAESVRGTGSWFERLLAIARRTARPVEGKR